MPQDPKDNMVQSHPLEHEGPMLVGWIPDALVVDTSIYETEREKHEAHSE